jgi:hypothetical protein
MINIRIIFIYLSLNFYLSVMKKILFILLFYFPLLVFSQSKNLLTPDDFINLFNSSYSEVEDFLGSRGYILGRSAPNADDKSVLTYQFLNEVSLNLIVLIKVDKTTNNIRFYTNNYNYYSSIKQSVKSYSYKEKAALNLENGNGTSISYISNNNKNIFSFITLTNNKSFKFAIEFTKSDSYYISW